MKKMTSTRMAKGIALGLLIAGPMAARAEMTLTQDGKAVAVIVHNGYTNQAASLRDYLAKITGAEISPSRPRRPRPAGRPAIVLETVGQAVRARAPGRRSRGRPTGSRLTARFCASPAAPTWG